MPSTWNAALALLRQVIDEPPPPEIVAELRELSGRMQQALDRVVPDGQSAATQPDLSPTRLLPQIKAATVRIGLYDQADEVFFGLGSGAIISVSGHILTAAHIFVGPKPNGPLAKDSLAFTQMYPNEEEIPILPRFEGRNEWKELVICIGRFVADEKPCEWAYTAKLLTQKEELMDLEKHALLDLAVLQLNGYLKMSPPGFKPTDPANMIGRTSEKYRIVELTPHEFDASSGLPAALTLGNPSAVAVGASRLAHAGWPSFSGESKIHVDNEKQTLVSLNGGFLVTKLYTHSAGSGGPCIDMETGSVVGVLSYTTGKHIDKERHKSYFRKVSLLAAKHGVPPALLAPTRGPAETGERPAQPLEAIGPFDLKPLHESLLDASRLHVAFDIGLGGGVLKLRREAESNNPSSDLWFDQLAMVEFEGEISPVRRLTLTGEERLELGIPSSASHFAFVYPCGGELLTETSGRTSVDKLFKNFVAAGGFVYFASAPSSSAASTAAAGESRLAQLLRGSALSPCRLSALLTSKGPGLYFSRIFLKDSWPSQSPGRRNSPPAQPPAHRACFTQLQRDKRLVEPTLEHLLLKGVRHFCWLFPSECIGYAQGQPAGFGGIDGAMHWPHGAFAYFYDEQSCEFDCVFAVNAVASWEAAAPRTAAAQASSGKGKKRKK